MLFWPRALLRTLFNVIASRVLFVIQRNAILTSKWPLAWDPSACRINLTPLPPESIHNHSFALINHISPSQRLTKHFEASMMSFKRAATPINLQIDRPPPPPPQLPSNATAPTAHAELRPPAPAVHDFTSKRVWPFGFTEASHRGSAVHHERTIRLAGAALPLSSASTAAVAPVRCLLSMGALPAMPALRVLAGSTRVPRPHMPVRIHPHVRAHGPNRMAPHPLFLRSAHIRRAHEDGERAGGHRMHVIWHPVVLTRRHLPPGVPDTGAWERWPGRDHVGVAVLLHPRDVGVDRRRRRRHPRALTLLTVRVCLHPDRGHVDHVEHLHFHPGVVLEGEGREGVPHEGGRSERLGVGVQPRTPLLPLVPGRVVPLLLTLGTGRSGLRREGGMLAGRRRHAGPRPASNSPQQEVSSTVAAT